MNLFAPKTFANIVAPLHEIHGQLQDLHEKHTNAIHENEIAIADLQADSAIRVAEQEQASKVRANITSLLAL